MGLELEELEKGIERWHENHKNWDKDFHNGFYASMADVNRNGKFDDEWWGKLSPHLYRWKATRPLSKAAITSEVTESFAQLQEVWDLACKPHLQQDITEVTCDQVGALPDLVATFKPDRNGNPTRSPVFRSKFCHFLAPAIFPVVDRAFMGRAWQSYENYFKTVQSEWASTTEKLQQQLRERMADQVGSNPTPGYPFVNKIVELSLAGRSAQK